MTTVVHDAENPPDVLSVSWGGPESSWSGQAMQALDEALASAAALGILVLCAAGDAGSSDGVPGVEPHVDFPASSPHATGCGGTRLLAAGGAIDSEVVWNDGAAGGATGGRVSVVFPLPAWQEGAGVPLSPAGTEGRGVPDVAADADPYTGYHVRGGARQAAYSDRFGQLSDRIRPPGLMAFGQQEPRGACPPRALRTA